jgi:hypothetical protein
MPTSSSVASLPRRTVARPGCAASSCCNSAALPEWIASTAATVVGSSTGVLATSAGRVSLSVAAGDRGSPVGCPQTRRSTSSCHPPAPQPQECERFHPTTRPTRERAGLPPRRPSRQRPKHDKELASVSTHPSITPRPDPKPSSVTGNPDPRFDGQHLDLLRLCQRYVTLGLCVRRRRVFGGLMSRPITALRPSPQAARLSDVHALRSEALGQVDADALLAPRLLANSQPLSGSRHGCRRRRRRCPG